MMLADEFLSLYEPLLVSEIVVKFADASLLSLSSIMPPGLFYWYEERDMKESVEAPGR